MDWYQHIIFPIITGIISGSIVAVVGVKTGVDYIKEYQLQKEIEKLKFFWSSNRKAKVYNLIFGVEYPDDDDESGEIEPRFGYAQSYGISEIPSILKRFVYHQVIINKPKGNTVNKKYQLEK